LQITRYLSLNENQFLGCLSAFVDTLSSELNGAFTFLQRLEHRSKGSAFAFEMQFDKHRYGALITLDRWARFTEAFAGHVELASRQPLFDSAAERVAAARKLLEQSNAVVDNESTYSSELVEACRMVYRTVEATFADEKKTADQAAALGPMLPEEFKDYRRVFLGDLSER
jgi:hypothetical protein